MAVKEHSFVLKRGEGLNNKNLIKHTVRDTILHVDSLRASSVDSSAKVDGPKSGKQVPAKSSYVSHMALTRQTRQRRQAGGINDATKDWEESSSISSPASSASTVSSSSNGSGTEPGTPSSKPPPRLIPSSGYIPKSGYLSKSGVVSGEDATGGTNGRLPKFGSWNNHNEENSPCYTLLFENLAQEKRSGEPIRIHPPPGPNSPAITEDLYNYNPTTVKAARKNRQSHGLLPGLLCCFVGS